MVQVIGVMHNFGEQRTIDTFRQFDALRVFGEAPRHRGHAAIQSGREQECLPVSRQTRGNHIDILDESHVEHSIRLVKHEGLDTRQVNATPFHVIEHTAGGCNDEL